MVELSALRPVSLCAGNGFCSGKHLAIGSESCKSRLWVSKKEMELSEPFDGSNLNRTEFFAIRHSSGQTL
jgi:hypothetical protein